MQSQARLTLPLKPCWAWLSFFFLSLNNLPAWVQSNAEQISQVLVSWVAEMGSEGKKSARSRVNCKPPVWRSLLQADPEGVLRDQFCLIRGLACLQKYRHSFCACVCGSCVYWYTYTDTCRSQMTNLNVVPQVLSMFCSRQGLSLAKTVTG